VWDHALSQLEEKLMNLKPFCLLFDSSLTVQQTDTCRGSSALWKFQSSSCFSVYACLFSLLLHFNTDTVRRKIIDDLKLLLLGFPTCGSTNRFLPRELCHGEVLYLLLFSSSNLAFLPTTVFYWCHWWEKVSKHMKLLHPLLHSPLANPQTNLNRESSAT